MEILSFVIAVVGLVIAVAALKRTRNHPTSPALRPDALRSLPGHHRDTGRSHQKTVPVAGEIDADSFVRRHRHAAVENRPTDSSTSTELRAVQEDGVLELSPAVEPAVRTQYAS